MARNVVLHGGTLAFITTAIDGAVAEVESGPTFLETCLPDRDSLNVDKD